MSKLNLSNVGPMSNVIINGDFNIWQRGASLTNPVSLYTTDRFQYLRVGVSAVNILRSSDVPTLVQSGHKSNYSLHADVTTIDASIAVTDYCLLSQKIEGYNMQALMGKQVTLSFWVKATKTGAYHVCLQNVGGDESYIIRYTVNTTDTWEKKTHTLTMHDGSSGTWDHTTGNGLSVYFVLAAGSNRFGNANVWTPSNVWCTSDQVNFTDNVANNFRLSQVKFEIGSVATPFIELAISEEIELCQRYYEISGVGSWGNSLWWSGDVTSGQPYYLSRHYRVFKRVVPTVVHTNYSQVRFGTTAVGHTVGQYGLSIYRVATSTGANGYYGQFFTASAEI